MAYEYHKKNFFLNEMFPGQFDTIPHIIIWAIVYFIDVAAVFAVAHLLGLPLPGKVGLMLYLVAAFALFCLESWIYHKIRQ
ncbi:MAG: hypothetical protein E7431_03190 [Ruminococcaceae bacterium]|nr:hypothetical protein [Oscillospiraceae bacterium]